MIYIKNNWLIKVLKSYIKQYIAYTKEVFNLLQYKEKCLIKFEKYILKTPK